MKNLTAENKLVVALFIMVLVTFSFAQKDSKKIEQLYARSVHQQIYLSSAADPAPEGRRTASLEPAGLSR